VTTRRRQDAVADRREEYHTYPPRSALGMLTPAEIADRWRQDHRPQPA